MELKLITFNNRIVADSREVSLMTKKDHSHLLRDIRSYLEVLGKSNFGLAEFFIEGYYNDDQGKPRPMFYLTKKGCDMVANKMTGEKGILFTASYVTKFEEMEKQIDSNKYAIPQNFAEALRLAADAEEQKQQLLIQTAQQEKEINELKPKATYYDLILQNKSLLTTTQIAKDYGWSATRLNKCLHDLGVQYKQSDCWVLYQKYADKGYTHTQTHVIDADKSKPLTKWTQKGRKFIYELLMNKEGILPMIERELIAN